MSIFSPDLLLDSTIETAGSTKRELCPPGVYLAMIGEPKAAAWTSRKDPSNSGFKFDIPFEIMMTDELKKLTGRDKMTLTHGIMLELTEAGTIDMGKGKNVALNRLREAVGQNADGQKWNARMLQGKMVTITVKHEPSADGKDIYDRVDTIAGPK